MQGKYTVPPNGSVMGWGWKRPKILQTPEVGSDRWDSLTTFSLAEIEVPEPRGIWSDVETPPNFLTWHGKSTMNEDEFPIENGGFFNVMLVFHGGMSGEQNKTLTWSMKYWWVSCGILKFPYTSSSRASRWRKFQKKKEPYSRERICL